ncbi:YrdB family protein [Amycolatopsis alkalitolerans]|uniref:YrdB family protein n=1 Tax=Amycolatopsis alkalitolerans TaxID=2547244 RepID=UPI001F2433D1|nr:YrdB family protein [Amycolatopsis alkalitolerans]
MNDGLAFLLELLALAALAHWGFAVGDGAGLKIVLGVGAPVLAAVVWSLFAAPRASFGLPVAGVLVVKAVVFGAAVAALFATGHAVLAVVFAVLVVLNTGYVTVVRRPRRRGPSAIETPPLSREGE